MNSVFVLHTQFTTKLPDDVFDEYFTHLPKTLQETNKRYLRWQDRTSNLLGKILLNTGLKEMGLKFRLGDIKFGTFNKPFFDESVDFSISHSGEYVACALGVGQKLGIDIEEIRKIQLNDFQQVFTKEQLNQIHSASDPCSEFFRMWTAKESVVKADGRGLSLPLLNIGINGNKATLSDNEWFLQNLDIAANYSASLAHNQEAIEFFEYKFNPSKIMLE